MNTVKYFAIGFVVGLATNCLIRQSKKHRESKSNRAFTITEDGTLKIHK